MKKDKVFLGLIFVSLLSSCEKSDLGVLDQESTSSVEINEFMSKDELNKVIYSSSPTTSYLLREKSATQTKAGFTENEDSFSEDLLSDLIPNDNFRNLVNAKGEFIVADTLYKITPLGTFYTHVANKGDLDNLDLSMVKSAPYVGDKLKQFGSVFLYETFPVMTESEEQGESPNYDLSDMMTRSASASDISSFPVKNASRWTVVGGWRDDVFGEDKWHYEPIQSRRRIAANLYDYNYVVTKQAGFKAKVQHNETWFKTWGLADSWRRPLEIGWKDMLFEISIPEFSQVSKPQKAIYVSKDDSYSQYASRINFDKHPFAVGGSGVDNIIPITYNLASFSYVDLDQMIVKFRKNELVSGMNNQNDNGFMVDVPNQNKRFIYIQNSMMEAKAGEISKIFFKGDGFVIGAGNTGNFLEYLVQSMKNSHNMKNYRLVSGEAYACTTNASGQYKGMIVRKYNN